MILLTSKLWAKITALILITVFAAGLLISAFGGAHLAARGG